MTKDQEFEEFAHARLSHLHRSAWPLCRDRHQAEDLVQETLAKVYVRWRQRLARPIDNPAATPRPPWSGSTSARCVGRAPTRDRWACCPTRAAPTRTATCAWRRPAHSTSCSRSTGSATSSALRSPTSPTTDRNAIDSEFDPGVAQLLQRALSDRPDDPHRLVTAGISCGRALRRRRRTAGTAVAALAVLGVIGVIGVIGAVVPSLAHHRNAHRDRPHDVRADAPA
jgi:hypothetical protein